MSRSTLRLSKWPLLISASPRLFSGTSGHMRDFASIPQEVILGFFSFREAMRNNFITVNAGDCFKLIGDIAYFFQGGLVENVALFYRDHDNQEICSAKGFAKIIVHLDVFMGLRQELVEIGAERKASSSYSRKKW